MKYWGGQPGVGERAGWPPWHAMVATPRHAKPRHAMPSITQSMVVHGVLCIVEKVTLQWASCMQSECDEDQLVKQHVECVLCA